MLEAVAFRRFKRFSEQDIPLRPQGVSLVAGGNNAGKSTILHGLAIWEFCRTVIEAEKGFDAFLPTSNAQGLGLGDDEFSPIKVPSLRHLWTNLASQKAGEDQDGYTLRIRCRWRNQEDAKHLEFGLALANDRLFIKTTDSNLTADERIPHAAYLPPFAGITDREARVAGAIRRRRIGEGLAGAVLRNVLLDLHQKNISSREELRAGRTKISDAGLRSLRETDPWELLQQTLRKTFQVELSIGPFKEEYHSYIRVEIVKGTVTGYKLTRHPGYKNRDLMVEGSGLLQWLSVYALATDPQIDMLLLDEPDAHLHCSLQQQLLEALVSIAEKTKKQVLIATHSTEILKDSSPTAILEVSTRRPPRFLSKEYQKVGLLAGLGSDYAPRIDALKQKKRLLLLEGDLDGRILRLLAGQLGRELSTQWVEWKSASGHKERKHFFIALKEEIPDLVAVSLRDRDDEPGATVDDRLGDRGHDGAPEDFHCKKWKRRHIESYLLWPAAIGSATGQNTAAIEAVLRDDHAIAVGASFPDSNAPQALLDVRGKEVLAALNADPVEVAKNLDPDKIPADIRTFLDELDRLALQEEA